MNHCHTKEKILDAAERLFAAGGVRGASLRAITAAAGVNLAAVNYHFGTKEALAEAVLSRRLAPLNEVRLRNLDAVRAEARDRGGRPEARALLRAFLEPTLRFRDTGPGAAAFVALVGRAMAGLDETARGAFLKLIEPVFGALAAALAEALPHLAPEVVTLRLHFALGAFIRAMCTAESPLEPPVLDTDQTLDQLVAFTAAGMEAP